jgi:hypothetical protein
MSRSLRRLVSEGVGEESASASERPYVAPTGDEPLDHRELALVRALLSIILGDLRTGEAATTDAERPSESGHGA